MHLALHLLKEPDENQASFQGVAFWDQKWPVVKEGDEVLATPMTCTASNWPILANGLKIKWVDIDPKTLNMDLDDLARKISPTTKAIMLVHWGGYPNDLRKIKEIQEKAEEYNNILEKRFDCVTFGSEYDGRKMGNHGNLTMYSLQAIKHITSIDGGVLISPHKKLHDRGKLIRWYGIDRDGDRKDFRCEADIPEWGYKFHMNDVVCSNRYGKL